jgi:hypothetical protein
VPDDDQGLSRAIRDTYRLAMRARYADGVAITECVAILRLHRPQLVDADARRMVARMLADEPTL